MIPLAELLTYRAMALKPLVIIPDKQLRSKSAKVAKITRKKMVREIQMTGSDLPVRSWRLGG